MKRLSLLLFLSVGLFSFAQNAITIEQKAKHLLRFIDKFHLQPKELDEVFYKDMTSNFLTMMDPEKVLFTQSELEEYLSLSHEINAQIDADSITFITDFKTNFRKAVIRSERIVDEMLNDGLELENPVLASKKFKENFPAGNQMSEKWNFILRKDVFKKINQDYGDKKFLNSTEQERLVIVDSIMSTLKTTYSDYFQNLRSLDIEINTLFLNAIAFTHDPHSSYFTLSEKESFDQELSSNRELFGISYFKNNNGQIEISAIVPGSSAWLSNEIHTGDVILSMQFDDGEKQVLTNGMTRYEVSELFDANDAKQLTLEINNAQNELNKITLVKGRVYSDSDIIKTAILEGDKNIGYISLPDFYTNWTDTTALGCANDVARALIKLKRENIEGLILDLRNNGGGSLYEALDLAGIFIDFGPIMIQKDFDGELYSLKDLNRGSIYRGPLIVLINENSASASEIVAGALKDYNRAVIVGNKSFGKATGQSMMPLDPGIGLNLYQEENEEWGYVKITNMGIYRINQSTNQLVGMNPDVVLVHPYKEDHFREESFPNALLLDSIEKKMYYKADNPLPVNELNENSLLRQKENSNFKVAKDLFAKKDSSYITFQESGYTLSGFVRFMGEQNIFDQELDDLSNQPISNYQSRSLSYDADIYSLSEYMKTYRDNFLKSVNTDNELSEAFSIILDLIELEK